MSRVSRILQRGAMHVALERGLSQENFVTPTAVPYDRSLLSVAGDVVTVKGVPVIKTGRILPDNPDAELERNVYLETMAREIDRQHTESLARIQARPAPEKFRPKDIVHTVKEPSLSLYAYRKPGLRRVFDNGRPQRWSIDGHEW
jgi:hypothetical protein